VRLAQHAYFVTLAPILGRFATREGLGKAGIEAVAP
jgi:hypothetical protein